MRGLRAELERIGWVLVRASEVGEDLAREANDVPWKVAERLFGEHAEMVERQPIRAIPGGRSFASSDVFTPLHTDSQPYLGAPPSAQVMICVRPAARGGETILADGWAIARRALTNDADLARRIFDEPRRIAFYFGDVVGPTIARWRDHVAFTHAPIATRGDELGPRVRALVDTAPLIEMKLEVGDVLVVDNHRMLHGRRAFADRAGEPPREFVRLLVWLTRPFAVDQAIAERARDAPHVPPPPLDEAGAAHRHAVVMEMLRGAPPGMLSTRERVSEAELYRWRDAALGAVSRGRPSALGEGSA